MSGIITHISAISSAFAIGRTAYYIEPEDGETLEKLHRKLRKQARLTGKQWRMFKVDGALCIKPRKGIK